MNKPKKKRKLKGYLSVTPLGDNMVSIKEHIPYPYFIKDAFVGDIDVSKPITAENFPTVEVDNSAEFRIEPFTAGEIESRECIVNFLRNLNLTQM